MSLLTTAPARDFWALVAIAEATSKMFGYALFVEPSDRGLRFFEFDRIRHDDVSQELWGFGLHAVLSNVRLHQTRRREAH